MRVPVAAALAAAFCLLQSPAATAATDLPPSDPGAASTPTYPVGSVLTATAHLFTLRAQLLRVDLSGLSQSTAQATVDQQLWQAQDRIVPLFAHRSGKVPDVVVRVRARDFEFAPETVTLPAPDAVGGAPLRQDVVLHLQAALVRRLATRAAPRVALRPHDSSARLVGAHLSFDPGRIGASIDAARLPGALVRALQRGSGLLPLRPVTPRYGGNGLTQVIVIRTAANTLDFYTLGKAVRHLTVATGQAGYPTPHGLFHVIAKQPAPSWYNPHDDWSRDLPDVIGPGPDNPLGTRALQLDAPGILIHGIPVVENATLGRNASHGCIRVRRSDIEALYPLVPAGTPVVIVS
jgi:hypothetical protein